MVLAEGWHVLKAGLILGHRGCCLVCPTPTAPTQATVVTQLMSRRMTLLWKIPTTWSTPPRNCRSSARKTGAIPVCFPKIKACFMLLVHAPLKMGTFVAVWEHQINTEKPQNFFLFLLAVNSFLERPGPKIRLQMQECSKALSAASKGQHNPPSLAFMDVCGGNEEHIQACSVVRVSNCHCEFYSP